ncbi:MAG: FecR domain-containing protein [Rhodospirillales bacterium]|nr:FecR domain-containing protein [Rhodospirillales bacterium]
MPTTASGAAAATTETEAIGQVAALRGSATVVLADGSTADLGAGASIATGARLVTGADSAMSVVLADGTAVALGAASSIVVVGPSAAVEDGAGRIRLAEAEGVIVVYGQESSQAPDVLTLETSMLAIADGGARIGVRVDPATGLHEVALLETADGEARGVAIAALGGGFEPLLLDVVNQSVTLLPGAEPVVKVATADSILATYGDALQIMPAGVASINGEMDLDAIAAALDAFDTAAGGSDGAATAPETGPIDVSNAEKVFTPAGPITLPPLATPAALDAAASAPVAAVEHAVAPLLQAVVAAAPVSNLQGRLANVSTSEDAPTDPIPVDLSVTGANGALTVITLNGAPFRAGQTATLFSGAEVTLQPDNTFLYDPDGQYEALPDAAITFDQFSFEVRDGTGRTAPATVEVAIQGVNDPPVANPDAITVHEDGASPPFNPLANDTDVDDFAELTLTQIGGVDINGQGAVVLPSGALVTVLPDRSLIYEARDAFEPLGLGETATDAFTYTVSDGQGGVATGDVVVTILGENEQQVGGVGERAITSFEFSLGGFASMGQVDRVGRYQETDGERKTFDPVDGDGFALLTAEGRSFGRPSTGLTSFLDVDMKDGVNFQVFTDLDGSQPVNGAAMKTTIPDLIVGDTVSFWAAFDNRDFAQAGKNDLAVVTVDGAAFKLFDGRGVDRPPALNQGAADWTFFSYEVQSDGPLDLGFAVLDDNPDFSGDAFDSRLLVDDVRVNADTSGYTIVATDPTGALATLAPNPTTG